MNMRQTNMTTTGLLCWAITLILSASLLADGADGGGGESADNTPAAADANAGSETEADQAEVTCANLVYAVEKSSVCFSDRFLAQAREDTHIVTHPAFEQVELASQQMFDYPFAVMTGEGAFELTDDQRQNLRDYLTGGGFLVASAGCSSEFWMESFRGELQEVFPDTQTVMLEADHPVFHSVYDITSSRFKTGGPRLPHLEGLTIDGRVVLILSPDGLNDTDNAGDDCCCCGGNEARSARNLNVNILAYALTH